jgi:dual specificity tyrosine-phosphorylation-regulated kinase 2/3/4
MENEKYYTNTNEDNEKEYDKFSNLILKKYDSIDSRYKILEEVGKGVFGRVYKANDYKRNQTVAIKVIRNEDRFHTQVKQEIKLFEKLLTTDKKYSDYLIPLYRWFTYKNDYFLVFELFGINMYSYYLKHEIDDDDLRTFSYQIADGLDFIHSFKIIHMDLKPENILVKNKHIKIIDLGSSFIETSSLIKTYVQSRYYRAPEVLFKYPLNVSMDIWSYGCVLYEIAMRRPLIPAKNQQDLIVFYKYIMGPPPQEMVDTFYNYELSLHTSMSNQGRYYPENGFIWDYKNNKFNDLIRCCCLTWDASKRLTAKEIKHHPYFTTFNSPSSDE